MSWVIGAVIVRWGDHCPDPPKFWITDAERGRGGEALNPKP